MWGRLACVVAIAAVSIDSPRAQDAVAEFYKGRQVTIMVGSSAGGGYDIYARLLARHMPRHIPGSPAMVVSNMAGAGSNAAAAHVYNVAPKDGTVIGALQNSAVLESLLDAQLGDTKRLRHDATKFVHVGSATIDHYVCIARADADVKSFKDLLTRELIIGASQPGTSTRDFPAMLNNMAGARFRLVSGYPGTREITLAIEKNEVGQLAAFERSQLVAHLDVGRRIRPHHLNEVLSREHHIENLQFVIQPSRGVVICVGAVAEDSARIPDRARVHRHVTGFLAQPDAVDDPFGPRLAVAETRLVIVRKYAEYR